MNSIPKLLIGYTKSILQEETHLLILAWLERSGEMVESELAAAVGKESHHVKKCLLDLHENRFVSYRESTVRITEAGKEVLDRLGIAEKVIESAMRMLNMPNRYRSAIEHLLNQYRDSAYDYYLDTQASVHCYNLYHNACHFSIAETKASKEFQTVANVAIILRDLRNWMRHSTEGLFARHSLQSSEGPISSFRFLGNHAWHIGYHSSAIIQRSLELLTWSEDSFRTIDEISTELEASDKTVFDKLFLVYSDFQRRCTRETWFPRWSNSFEKLESAQKSPKLSHFYEVILQHGSLQRSLEGCGKSGDWEGWWAKMPPSYLNTVIVDHTSVALGHLLTSKTLKEFCRLTELDKEAANLLLKRISSKIHSLLNDD